MGGRDVQARPDRTPRRPPDRDRLSVEGMDAGPLSGRLPPSAMFPAGHPAIRTRYVTLQSGVRVRLVESGRADVPAVLLLHGWGASVYMWRAWFAPLAAMDRRVIAIDLPGHGLSDKPE